VPASYNTVTNYPYTAASYNTVTNYPYVPASYNAAVTNYPYVPASYNTITNYPYAPGVPGDPTTVLGVYFPGGNVGAVAPYVPETPTNYWDYPDNATYPVTVPSGGYIVVKIE
jgi:hypothetical protein